MLYLQTTRQKKEEQNLTAIIEGKKNNYSNEKSAVKGKISDTRQARRKGSESARAE